MPAAATTKTCSRCHTDKSLDEFGSRKSAKDGKAYWCKPCVRSYQRGRWEDNAAGVREKSRVLKNTWRAANPENHRTYARRWKAANPEKAAEQRSRWRSKNPDKMTQYAARRRAVKLGARHEPYSRADIFKRWSSLCCYCDSPAVHLDHVHALANGGEDAAHNLVPACAGCNLGKGSKSLAEWALSWR